MRMGGESAAGDAAQARCAQTPSEHGRCAWPLPRCSADALAEHAARGPTRRGAQSATAACVTRDPKSSEREAFGQPACATHMQDSGQLQAAANGRKRTSSTQCRTVPPDARSNRSEPETPATNTSETSRNGRKQTRDAQEGAKRGIMRQGRHRTPKRNPTSRKDPPPCSTSTATI